MKPYKIYKVYWEENEPILVTATVLQNKKGWRHIQMQNSRRVIITRDYANWESTPVEAFEKAAVNEGYFIMGNHNSDSHFPIYRLRALIREIQNVELKK